MDYRLLTIHAASRPLLGFIGPKSSTIDHGLEKLACTLAFRDRIIEVFGASVGTAFVESR
jgi:hypothetical protein